jgi:hypothetical protein
MSTTTPEDDEMTDDELAEEHVAVVDAQEEAVLQGDASGEDEPDGGEEDGDDLGPDWDPDGGDD